MKRSLLGWGACLLFTAILLGGPAPPARAKAPEPVQVPAELPQPLKGRLTAQRGELVLRWDRLVERVKAHNQHCYAVKAGSPQGKRCAANMAAIRREIGAYIAAVERFNLAVAAAEVKHDESRGEGPYSLLVPTDKEIELGREVAAKIESQCVLNRDPQVNQYVQGLGWRLSRHSGRPGLPYSFKVIERIGPDASDGVRRACGLACAGPGGVIYLNRRAMKYLRNESELAGVLAHEIGHVAARHQVKELIKVAKSEGIGLAAGSLSSAPVVNKLVRQYVADLAYFKFTRDQEREADRRAVQMLYSAGIKPTGLSAFLGRYGRGKEQKDMWDRLYATHPDPAARIKALNPLLADPRFNQIKHIDSPGFQKARAKLTPP